MMFTDGKQPVLIIGGSGIVGTHAVKILRRLQPDLPITIGGRNLAKARDVAKELDNVQAMHVDLGQQSLGLPHGARFSAIAVFVKDGSLHALRYAQASGIPYLNLSSSSFEIAPEVAFFAARPAAAPVMMASHWLAGTAVLPALLFAQEFDTLDSIEIAAVLDEQDMGGPAAYADYERIMAATKGMQILKNGQWIWVTGEDASRTITSIDGRKLPAQAYSPLDIVSLAATTTASSIRLDLVVGESSARRNGEHFSTEIIITLAGKRKDGTHERIRHEIVHPGGQAPLTGLGVAVALERLLGLHGGAPVPPGLYFPNSVIEPAYMLQQMQEFGVRYRRVSA